MNGSQHNQTAVNKSKHERAYVSAPNQQPHFYAMLVISAHPQRSAPLRQGERDRERERESEEETERETERERDRERERERERER